MQMTDAAAAKDAKQQLDGRSMPAYLVPNYTAGEIRMKVCGGGGSSSGGGLGQRGGMHHSGCAP